MQTPDNLDRSGRVATLVDIYREQHDKGEDNDFTLSDILTDTLHWCETYGVDFEEALGRAQRDYDAEVRGD